jgi:hypothetical protein
MKVKCNFCNGDGWTIESAHGCGGDSKKCATCCPVQVQEVCEACGGVGYHEVDVAEEE